MHKMLFTRAFDEQAFKMLARLWEIDFIEMRKCIYLPASSPCFLMTHHVGSIGSWWEFGLDRSVPGYNTVQYSLVHYHEMEYNTTY